MKWLPIPLLCLLIVGLFMVWTVSISTPPASPVIEIAVTKMDAISARQMVELLERVKQPESTAVDWNNAADALLVNGYLPEAIACYAAANDRQPEQFETLFWNAVALHMMGQMQQSTDAFEQALRLAPDRSMADFCHYGIGRNALRREQPDQAVAAFEAAVPFELATFELGRLLLRLNQPDRAQKHLEDLLKRQPQSQRVLQLLARAVQQQGHTDQAIVLYDHAHRAQDVFPSDGLIFLLRQKADQFGYKQKLQQAKTATQAGQLPRSAQLYEEMLSADWDPIVAYQAAIVHFRLEQYRRAEQLARQLLEQEGPSAIHLAFLGETLQRQDNREEAIEAWQASVALRPNWRVFEQLANHAEQNNQNAPADQYRFDMHRSRGWELLQSNQPAAAQTQFEHALTLCPQNAESLYGLAEAARLTGDFDRAEQLLTQAVQQPAPHPRAASRLLELPAFRRFGSAISHTSQLESR